jgi:hypothetical protein
MTRSPSLRPKAQPTEYREPPRHRGAIEAPDARRFPWPTLEARDGLGTR